MIDSDTDDSEVQIVQSTSDNDTDDNSYLHRRRKGKGKQSKGKIQKTKTLQEKWALFESKNEISEGIFTSTETSVRCSLCAVTFNVYRYAVGHHKRSLSHQEKYKVFEEKQRVRTADQATSVDMSAAKELEKEVDERYETVTGIYGMRVFTRPTPACVLCAC